MNTVSLSGLVVLITRPTRQSTSVQEAIESAGGAVLALPLIEIQPLVDAKDVQDLKDKVLQLDSYRSLIFVSNNAVSFGGEIINNFWPQFPVGVNVIAVGPTTAESARATLGCDVAQPTTGMTSEAILEMTLLQEVEGQKIGIVRGQGGRELLADTLRQRGAEVDYLEAYSRKALAYDAAQFCAELTAAGVNVLTASSGESLDKLTALLADNTELMAGLDLIVPSQRVAEQARNSGYLRVHNAGGADPSSFVAALGELNINQE